MQKNSKTILLNSSLIVFFALLIALFSVKYGPIVIKLINQPEEFRNFLASYGSLSILVYIFFQIIQVVITVIPGGVIQLTGGYVYGTLLGTVYSMIGILLGSIIVFYISRFLGRDLLNVMIPRSKIDKFTSIINNPGSEITMFLIFLIPGLPKDILVYIAGLTPIKPLKFFSIFMIASFPGMIASSYVGSHLQQGNYLPAIIVSIIIFVLFLIFFLKKEAIIQKIKHLHPRKDRS
jgi:uncharacterized membrane protein YdjX (TVP38/TMEM64 family)